MTHLYKDMLVPDVVLDFDYEVDISLRYGDLEVHDSELVPPSKAASKPEVRLFKTRKGKLYTLVMTDPDAPDPKKPKLKEWVHWIVTNIPGEAHNIDQGDEVLPYAPPSPPIGKHRYAFVVFKQPDATRLQVEPLKHRAHFSTRRFAEEHGLKAVGGMVYLAEAQSE